jgi:hypothetical protein
MTDAEFDEFVATSSRDLERKQADLTERYGLGNYATWAYDQTTALLSFSDADGQVRIEASAITIGSFSTRSQTWQWAWASPTVPEQPRAESARLKGLFDATGVDVFRLETFEADENMAWELAAMAVTHLGAVGCYRAPAGQLSVFLAIVSVVRR